MWAAGVAGSGAAGGAAAEAREVEMRRGGSKLNGGACGRNKLHALMRVLNKTSYNKISKEDNDVQILEYSTKSIGYCP